MDNCVYICGDSFGVSDLDYGECWVDHLSKSVNVKNLSIVCASNLLISQQVDRAIRENADFIICLCTSSTRLEVLFQGRVIPFSVHSIDHTTKFDTQQKQILKKYINEFFDLDSAIYLNRCIIENTLQKLLDSRIPFLFDQGGFEHKSFGGIDTEYFLKYKTYKSKFNLWDYITTKNYRPYYHITDTAVHLKIANYYLNNINEQT
jgi:hypothetical protein